MVTNQPYFERCSIVLVSSSRLERNSVVKSNRIVAEANFDLKLIGRNRSGTYIKRLHGFFARSSHALHYTSTVFTE